MEVDDVHGLERTGIVIFRWIRGVTVKDRRLTQDLVDILGC